MTECMSQRTKDLLLLLSEDADKDELEALVESAFSDGLKYYAERVMRDE